MRGLGFDLGWCSGRSFGAPTQSDSGYPGHTMVTFHHDALVYQNSPVANWLPASASDFFFANKIRIPEYPTTIEWGLLNIGEGIDSFASGRFLVSVTGIGITDPGGHVRVWAKHDGAGADHDGRTFEQLAIDVDQTIHVAVNLAAAAQPEPDESLPGNGKTIATFAVPYTDGSMIYRGPEPQREGEHYVVLQRNPVARLQFSSPFSAFDGCSLVDGFAGSIMVWVNGIRQRIAYSNASSGPSIALADNNSNRAVIGAAHHYVSVPNYGRALGAQLDGYVGVKMGFVLFDTTKNEDPSTTSDMGKDIDLARFAAGGATPARLLLGGSQTYAAPEWDAGLNRGTAPITFSRLAT